MSIRAQKSLGKGDISLYVGIPFCPTRCSYCSFVSSSVEKSLRLIEPYLEALFMEIEAAARLVRETGLRIVSVYVGGGTPTTLTAAQLEALLFKLTHEFDFSSVREFTVEAGRADTIDERKLRAIKLGGAERISINPQTMDDEVLRAAGRSHTAAEVERAFNIARQIGFDVINADLIAGLPADTPTGFEQSLERLLTLAPENITVHTLALKKGSKLMQGGFLPSEEDVGAMLGISQALLRRAEYRPYYLYRQKFTAGNFENLGWCQKGKESLYNICMMEELHTIISLGGGAVTKLVAPKIGRIERIFNAKYPYEYINNIEKEIAEKEYLKSFLDKYE
jgi:oxygen-independent coproporphyrinogen-3 oxidase